MHRGAIAYASQTGLVGAQALPLEDCAFPVSKICDFGNKCDVNEIDLLEYLANDSETKVIAMHLEDIKESRQFMDIACRVVSNKPILILKPGRSQAAAEAVASHTGSLAGIDQIYDSAFRQAGIFRLDTWQEFLDIPKVFASQELPMGRRSAIFTFSGAAGIMAIDAAVHNGLTTAQLSSSTIETLVKISPRLANNPFDIGQIVPSVNNVYQTFESIVAEVLADDGVDCAIFILWAASADDILGTLRVFRGLKQQTSKPVAIWIYGPKTSAKEELARQLEAIGLPTYANLETATKALSIAASYATLKSRLEHQRA